jgi:hypothetical protein
MISCEICGRGPANGTTVYRANEKGVPGIWRCAAHVNERAFAAMTDPAIENIENALNGKIKEVLQ